MSKAQELDEEALERVKTFLFGSEEEVEQLLVTLGFPTDE